MLGKKGQTQQCTACAGLISLSTMHRKYVITACCCVAHAALLSAWVRYASGAPNFLNLQLLLLVAWPFWAIVLWRYSRGTNSILRLFSIAIPLLLGGYLFYWCGLLWLVEYIISQILHPGDHF